MASKKFIEVKDEDFVEFFIYPKVDIQINDNSLKNALEELDKKLKAITEELISLSSGYIWHSGPYELYPLNSVSNPPRFYGTLRYGENIEDEWFLVHILIKLTEKFSDVVVRIKDQDGEFLLIEAAEYLPSWVNPETCEDKVFLYNGHLHILPPSFSPPSEDEDEELENSFEITDEVLEFVRSRGKECLVKTAVEKVIFERIGDYPEKIDSSFHYAVVYVPVAIAALLKNSPHLVTLAVRAFRQRDLIDLRACRAMKYFPPEQRVLSRVKFTKCSYAMLVSSKFQPDKRTGWNLPAPTSESYKSHLLGIKLACGFEILLSQAKSQAQKRTNSDEDLSIDRDWLRFKESLHTVNYFRNLLEHSKEYNELLNSAQEFYRNICIKEHRKSPGVEIADLLDSVEIDIEELRRAEKDLSVRDEDDSWMDVSKEELDAMLKARFGGQDLVDVPNGKPEDISKHLSSFINHVSGVEGAEIPKNTQTSGCSSSAPERPKRGVKTKKKKNVKFSADTKMHSVTSTDQIAPAQNRVSIEPDGFMHAVQNILDFSIPDDNYWDSDGSGMSSYEDEDEMELGETSENKPKLTKMDEYMAKMDQELAATTMGESFVKKQSQENSKKSEGFDDVEKFEPVDIDMNALKNILLSYQSQMGAPGPAQTLLAPMGVNLEDIDADVD